MKCLRCNNEIEHHYMVRNEIWREHGVGRGYLCIFCLEDACGTLKPGDFTLCYLNVRNPFISKRMGLSEDYIKGFVDGFEDCNW